jgi:hypothetical protein
MAPPPADHSAIVDCNTAASEYEDVSGQLAQMLSAAPELAAEVDSAEKDGRVPMLPAAAMHLYDRANTLLNECPFEVCTPIIRKYTGCLAGQAEDAFGDTIRMCKNPPPTCQPFQ